MGASTVLAGLVLDKEQDRLPATDKYLDALAMSCFNLLLVGPFIHAWLTPHLSVCRSHWQRIWKAGGVVLIHSGLYAFIHRCMHRIRALRYIHAPHHRFDEDVTSSVANAVSADEFLLAYMLPFAVGAWIVRADTVCLNIATAVVSAANLMVHSPHLSNVTLPQIFVHPKDHLEHHRTRCRKYAAPTVAWYRVLRPRRKLDLKKKGH